MTSSRSRATAAPVLLARTGAVAAATIAPLVRTGVVAAATLLAVVGAALGAWAHEAGAGIRYRVDAVEPQVDGLTVQVVRGLTGQLVLGNDTGEVVEVLDDDGQPFLRIGPRGVEADVASPTWAASDRPFGLRGAAAVAPASGDGDRWTRLSDATSWGWYDHRLHEAELSAPAEATEPVVLETWEIPLRVGGRDVTVTGRTLAGPPLGFVTPRLVSDRTLAPGVAVTLLPGTTPGLLMTVEPGRDAVVRGQAGEPFLRFADGGVQVNAASPTWHRTGGAQADPVAVDGSAAPTWQRVADGQQFGWIEPRAIAPEVEGNPEDGTVLSTWAVPVEVEGGTATVLGELRWARNPAAGDPGGGLPWLDLVLAAAGVLAVVALVVVRRRGRRPRA